MDREIYVYLGSTVALNFLLNNNIGSKFIFYNAKKILIHQLISTYAYPRLRCRKSNLQSSNWIWTKSILINESTKLSLSWINVVYNDDEHLYDQAYLICARFAFLLNQIYSSAPKESKEQYPPLSMFTLCLLKKTQNKILSH
jgi:hypothetical protein